MLLKKTNAVLGLLSSIALLLHMWYNCFAYLTFYYNPNLTKWTSLPFIILTCGHAVCGMCSVFLMGDGTRLDLYPAKNRKTILQRVSAALIFPLLIVHMKTFDALKVNAESGRWWMFALMLILQLIFYAVVTLHTAVSFSKACITLGMIADEKKLKILERIVWCVFGISFLAVSIGVTRGELLMFIMK